MKLSFGFKLTTLLLILIGVIVSNIEKPAAIPFAFLFFFTLYHYGTYYLGSVWGVTPLDKTRKIVNAVNVRNKTVYDLGSGDGRIIITASKKGARSIGIEIDPLRYLLSRFKIKFSGAKNCKVIYGNFFKTDLRNADVVFMYLARKTISELEREKFLKELGKNARIVTYRFKCNKLKLVKTIRREKIYVYKVP